MWTKRYLRDELCVIRELSYFEVALIAGHRRVSVARGGEASVACTATGAACFAKRLLVVATGVVLVAAERRAHDAAQYNEHRDEHRDEARDQAGHLDRLQLIDAVHARQLGDEPEHVVQERLVATRRAQRRRACTTQTNKHILFEFDLSLLASPSLWFSLCRVPPRHPSLPPSPRWPQPQLIPDWSQELQ